ncbi:MAG: hypothetical protein ACI9W4_001205 [Rhodothermales bacterium]
MKRHVRRQQKHNGRVASALDAVLARHRAGAAPVVSFDPSSGGLIVFSDQHKGARDGADDFRRSERAYNAALAYYFQKGHTLVELGDVEELWEEMPSVVIARYPRTFALTRRFESAGRYWRIFGNHDDLWSFPDAVKRLLHPVIGETLQVHESVILELPVGKSICRLLLVHGHQGSTMSDGHAPLSRMLVRWLWRPVQRLTGWSPNTPARSWDLRNSHNQAMHRWAEEQSGLLLLAGHTHEPVFIGGSRVEQLERAIGRIGLPDGEADRSRLAALHAQLEWAMAERDDQKIPASKTEGQASNAYFNTGCCCYSDGDITGIEIADGRVRLVRWPDNSGDPEPEVLASADLAELIQAGPAASTVVAS